ncbi:MAG: rane protein [Bacilli bacterium]|nr:rane protein [Bacilli bacterium]
MISAILVGIVALEHMYILYLEMFLWTKPKGLKTFGTTREIAEASKSLAANQGLYNGFLAAGLFWSLLYPDKMVSHQIQLFFLICVLIAAIYGGLSVKRSILFVQGLPALVALFFIIIHL